MNPLLGLMGAMQEEVDHIRAAMSITHSTQSGTRHFHHGSFANTPTVLVFSRWGKVAAASTATSLIETHGCTHLLFIGVAGAASADLEIGDIVIADELVQHDLDVSPLPGFSRFEVPLLGVSRIKSDPVLSQHAWQAARSVAQTLTQNPLSSSTTNPPPTRPPQVLRGLIASGDTFMTDPARSSELCHALPGLLCFEMEGAAVAQVCHEHDIPFAVIRIISDRADHQAPIDFPQFVSTVAAPWGHAIAHQLLSSASMRGL